MPTYKYFCSACDKFYFIFHHSGEKDKTCPLCSGSLEKKFERREIAVPLDKKQVGEVTKRFIEDAKEDLETMKEEYKRENS